MTRLLNTAFFLLLFTCLSCNDKKQEGNIVSKEKMQAVLWDILQAEAFTANFIKKDSTKNEAAENAALQKKIFDLHKISRQDFTKSYDYYSSQPEQMRSMLDSMSAKAERERNKVMKERYEGMKTAVE
jgi:Domain of unknown function (DUF4296)